MTTQGYQVEQIQELNLGVSEPQADPAPISGLPSRAATECPQPSGMVSLSAPSIPQWLGPTMVTLAPP